MGWGHRYGEVAEVLVVAEEGLVVGVAWLGEEGRQASASAERVDRERGKERRGRMGRRPEKGRGVGEGGGRCVVPVLIAVASSDASQAPPSSQVTSHFPTDSSC